MTRAEALRNVQVLGLAVFDTMLFLDTHPTNRRALDFLRETRRRYSEAAETFERQFGPLRAGNSEAMRSWEWVEGPWPWEVEQ